MEYLFNFNNTFEIHDDVEVLKRMGMTFSLEKGACTKEELEKVKQMVPKSLESYVIRKLPLNSAALYAWCGKRLFCVVFFF